MLSLRTKGNSPGFPGLSHLLVLGGGANRLSGRTGSHGEACQPPEPAR